VPWQGGCRAYRCGPADRSQGEHVANCTLGPAVRVPAEPLQRLAQQTLGLLREVAGEAAVYAEDGDFAAAARHALAERDRLSAAGLERARLYSWEATARRTADVYREVLES